MSQAQQKRLGFLYPGKGGHAEGDYARLLKQLFPDESIVAEVVLTSIGEGMAVHTVEALMDTGERWRLREGSNTLKDRRADVAMWACTSGSFVFGLDGAQRQVDELAADFNGPASSTSLAFVNALNALNIHDVAVAASYPKELAQSLFDLLKVAGNNVLSEQSYGISTGAEVSRLPEEKIIEFIRAADHPRAKAILVPDTAMRSVDAISRFEAAVGKTVLTANQVTVWDALRLVGSIPVRKVGGSLFLGKPLS